MTQSFILADGRWSGANGIGRFSKEVIQRLTNTEVLSVGPRPLSLKNFIWLPYQLHKKKNHHRVFFMPGFNPVSYSPLPFVFTICDLIHLNFPGSGKTFKKIYYNSYIKPRTQQAEFVLTLSEYSKQMILEWANLPADKVKVVGCGVSSTFSPKGARFEPGFPYLLHVGNTKSHKNVERLLEAFAIAKIDNGIKLILTGELTPSLQEIIFKHHLKERIIFSGTLNEEALAKYYRGALGIVFPSLLEGFGLPVLEGMASGVPTLTSTTTSLAEIAGDAALLVDPYQIDSIALGLEQLVNDTLIRLQLVEKGMQRTSLFSWDSTAHKIQQLLYAFS